MASFPALPSGNNPYAAQAAGYASSAASVFNAIRSAAAAHEAQAYKQKQDAANQQRGDLQQQFQNFNELAKQGAVQQTLTRPDTGPLDGVPGGLPDEAAGERYPNPAAQGAGRTITEPKSGQEYYIPTDAEKARSKVDNDPGSVTLSDDLAKTYQDAGLTNAKAGVKYPGSMLEHFNSVLALHNKAAEPEAMEPVPGNFSGQDGKPVMLHRGQKSGKLAVAPLPDGVSIADKPEKTARSENENDWIRIATDPTSDPKEVVRAKAALDLQKKMRPATDAQIGMNERAHVREQDKADALSQKRTDSQLKAQGIVADKHDAFQSKERDQWDLSHRYAELTDPTKNPDGGTVFLPSFNEKTGEITDGPPRTMNSALRATFVQNSAQAQRKAVEHQQNAAKVRKSMGWGEFAPASGQGAGSSGTSTQAQPVAPGRGGRGGGAKKPDPLGVR